MSKSEIIDVFILPNTADIKVKLRTIKITVFELIFEVTSNPEYKNIFFIAIKVSVKAEELK